MQLQSEAVEIIRSSNIQEKTFGIGDVAVILNILRSKMYSNPIRTMIQEILSNARDAHREIGKSDVPIEVSCPEDIAPFFYIKDYGPGITPDRMENIFLMYGNSTKRDNNTQTGGFGIGAKTPFAYSDSFSIDTVTDELGYHMHRSYSAYIDESNMGKLALMNEEITDEPNGTKITVPVKQEDLYRFKSEVFDICRWWKVKPKTSAEFQNIDIKEDNDDYIALYERVNNIILIDEIPYPINLRSIASVTLDDEKYNNIIKCINVLFNETRSDLVLKFKTGEITVTPTREAIEYTNENVIAFLDKVHEILSKMVIGISGQIEACETYLDAVRFSCAISSTLRNIYLTVNNLTVLFWKNIPIVHSLRGIKITQYTNNNGKMVASNVDTLTIYNGIYAIDNCPREFSIANKIRSLLSANPSRTISVIKPLYEWKEIEEADDVSSDLNAAIQIISDEKCGYKIPKSVTEYNYSIQTTNFLSNNKAILDAIGIIKISEVTPEYIKREKSTKTFSVWDMELEDTTTGTIPNKHSKFIYAISKNKICYLNYERGYKFFNYTNEIKNLEIMQNSKIYFITPSEVVKYKNAINIWDYLYKELRKLSNDMHMISGLETHLSKERIQLQYPVYKIIPSAFKDASEFLQQIYLGSSDKIETFYKLLSVGGYIDIMQYPSQLELDIKEFLNKYPEFKIANMICQEHYVGDCKIKPRVLQYLKERYDQKSEV